MSEANWVESDAAIPPPKKKLPTWLWFCGGGCLLGVILLIAVVAWGASKIKEATNPEKQWAELATVLPYDQRPPDLEIEFGVKRSLFAPIEHLFIMKDSNGFMIILMHFGEGEAAGVRNQLLNPKFDGSFMGIGGRKNLVAGTLNVQGREIPVLRFSQQARSKGDEEHSIIGSGRNTGRGAAAIIDLTPVDDPKPLVLQMMRVTEDESPVSDDDIRAFLKNFHVGKDR